MCDFVACGGQWWFGSHEVTRLCRGEMGQVAIVTGQPVVASESETLRQRLEGDEGHLEAKLSRQRAQ